MGAFVLLPLKLFTVPSRLLKFWSHSRDTVYLPSLENITAAFKLGNIPAFRSDAELF